MLQKCTEKLVNIFFKTPKTVIPISVPFGQTVLEAAHANKIELEGACEGNLACSTCHVILEDSLYKKLNEPSDKEYDLLDQAFMPTSTSRLGCQLKIDKSFDGAIISIPRATKNMAVDGYVPKPH